MTVAANPQEHSPSIGTGQRFRLTLRIVWFACMTVMLVFVAGFFYFSSLVQQTVRLPVAPANADGIIVLTGGSERISDGIGLLRDKRGTRLLISGVNPRTTAGQLAQRTGTAKALFLCCIDLDYAAQNTFGNAVEGARWATGHGFDSLILVTSAYHMPRTMLEFSRLMPQVQLHPWPVALSTYSAEDWWTNPAVLRIMIGEYSKYLMASAKMRVGEATRPLPGTIRSQAH